MMGEKIILAIGIQYPHLTYLLFQNLGPGDFKSDARRAIFKGIHTFLERGEQLSLGALMDRVGGSVPPAYYREIIESMRGVTAERAEAVLTQEIARIKRTRGQMEVLRKINEVVQKPELERADVEELKSQVEEMEVIGREKEHASIADGLVAYQALLDKPETGITLGLPSYDKLIDGFQPGELITIMARTRAGKTFLALNILDHLVRTTDHRCGFFSLEMARAAITERMIQVHHGFGRHEVIAGMRDGSIILTDFIRRYEKARVYEKIYSVPDISAIIDEDRLAVVFVDFVHLVRSAVTKGANEYQRITGIYRDFKQLAKDKKIVCFLLHQLSRQGGSGWEPVRVDMARDSGSVEEYSDFLIGAWCRALNPDLAETNRNEITIALLKNKRGPTWVQDLYFDERSRQVREQEREPWACRTT